MTVAGVSSGHRLWERRSAHDDFAEVRIGLGPQRLALRLEAPQTKPVEDLEPLCASALRRFLRAYATVPDLPVPVYLRGLASVVFEGDEEVARGLVRAMLAQLAVLHSPDELQTAVCAGSERLADWDWVKWLPHALHPFEQDAAGPARLVADSWAALEAMLDGLGGAGAASLESNAGFAATRAQHPDLNVVLVGGIGGTGGGLAAALAPLAGQLAGAGVTVWAHPQPVRFAPNGALSTLAGGAGHWQGRTPKQARVDAYVEVYKQARERKARGQSPVQFFPDGVPGGHAGQPPLGYGLEIEFGVIGVTKQERATAIRAIGEELVKLVAVESPELLDPRFVRDYSRWHYVDDVTTNGGEIVSRIMHGTSEENVLLAKVLAAVRTEHGEATDATGGHINVSTDQFGADVAPYVHLLQLVKVFEDTLYRLGNHPDGGRTRDAYTAMPNPAPSTGYASITSLPDLTVLGPDKFRAVNLLHVKGKPTDRVEFRLWSGSTDPACGRPGSSSAAPWSTLPATLACSRRSTSCSSAASALEHMTTGAARARKPIGPIWRRCSTCST